MSDLIRRSALKEFIDDCGICAICPQKAPRCSYDCDFPDVVTEKWNVAIDAQPTIDAVEVVHGEWTAKNSHTMYCSVCGFEEVAWRTQDYGYCPNCGAKMKGADNGQTHMCRV